MNFWNILFAQKHGASPTGDFFEEQLAGYTKPSEVKTLTGVPPLTFVSDGSNLKNWTIFGADPGVGERTENLFDVFGKIGKYDSNTTISVIDAKTISITGIYYVYQIYQVKPNTDYYLYTIPYSDNSQAGRTITGVTNSGTGPNVSDVVANYSSTNFSFSFNTGERHRIALLLYASSSNVAGTVTYSNTMLTHGSTVPSSYIPYGYKIPVETRERSGNAWNVVHTTNIYTQTQLGSGDTLTKEQTGVDIPTVDGNNTLTVGTTVQPSSMTIVYNGK
jgi:hypothetical protein